MQMTYATNTDGAISDGDEKDNSTEAPTPTPAITPGTSVATTQALYHPPPSAPPPPPIPPSLIFTGDVTSA